MAKQQVPEIFGPIHIHDPVHHSAPPEQWPSLDASCCIGASGTGNPTFVDDILHAWANVNGGPTQDAAQSGLSWAVGPVGPCSIEGANTLSVQIKFLKNGVEELSGWENREFRVHAGDCEYYYFAAGASQMKSAGAGGGGKPIQELLPRYYRLSLHAFGGQPRPALGAFAGGLLQSNPLYLAYDEDASTPEEAVWRALNLPSMCGRWTLRVRGGAQGLAGDLTLHATGGDQIAPPLRFYAPCWNAQGLNHLSATGNGRASAGNGALSGASLLVEPA